LTYVVGYIPRWLTCLHSSDRQTFK